MHTSTLAAPARAQQSGGGPLLRSEQAARLLALTGTARLSDAEVAAALFGFPLILTLADDLDAARACAKDTRGRRQGFPTAALIAVSALARHTGSLPEALKVLSAPGVWDRCRQAWDSFEGVAPLPPFPPERHRITHLRKLINDEEQAIEVLKAAFTGGAVRMAKRLGNFGPGQVSPLKVDPAHTIFGDGSILRPMTDVMEHVNELTGEVQYLGSRAKVGKPRVQTAVRQLTDIDHPGQVGINFVAIHTETPFGLVTLGVEATLRAEQWAALDILERIYTHTGDRVHSLVYDGALTGWVKDALMGCFGIELLQKGRSRSEANASDRPTRPSGHRQDSRAVKDGLRILDIDATVAAEAADRLAEHDAALNTVRVKHSTAYLDRVTTLVRHTVLTRLWHSGAPLPVGTSLYPSARNDDGYDLLNSQYDFVCLTHDVHGSDCSHELVIDDGALFTVAVDENTGYPVKSEYLPCMEARRHRVGSRFTLERSYLLPCVHGDVTWTYTWTPTTPLYRPGDKRPAPQESDRRGQFLSTIPRVATSDFAPVLRLRNYSESYNNWFKSALPRFGRAASITQAGQEFDFLMAALAMNALTWSHAHH